MSTKVTINLKGLERATKAQKRKIYSAIARSDFKETLKKELIIETRIAGLSPSLKRASIKYREYLARYNNMHAKFRAAFSNLTATGELLDSMKSFYVTAQNQFRFIFPEKKHKPYKKSNGRNMKGKQSTMKQIYEWQSDAGRNIQEQIINRKSFLDKVSAMLVKSVQRFIRY
jgi:hypothetical protein